MIIRQGDLVFRKIDEVIAGKSCKKLVIAEGEATGHSHLLSADTATKIYGDKTKFMLTGKAKLMHPEHETITFLKGTYVVINEREFDYAEEQMRKVQD